MSIFLKQSYPDDFEHLLLNLKDKYPKSIFQYEGIDDTQLDMTQYSKNYFIKGKNIADVTIDQNANVQIKDVVNYKSEMHKGADKLNSLFLIWKMARKLWNTREANKLIEEEICKDINIQDSTHSYLPYSYYGQTPIIIKINNKIKYWTMKQLYDCFENNAIYNNVLDYYKIKIEDLHSIYEPNWIIRDLESYGRTNSKNSCSYIGKVKEKINIEILDKNGWVKLKQIIRHKYEESKDFIIYQTNNGDFSFVTEDHPVILSSGKEKKAIDLEYGDEIVNYDKILDYNPYIYIPENVAYITGFILGDGNIGSYSYNYDYIKRNKLGNITPHLNLCRGDNTIMIYQKDFEFSIINKKLKETFLNIKYYKLGNKDGRVCGFTSRQFSLLYGDYFNCGKKSNSFSKRLPENILNWEESSFLALLSGLIDSDGSINNGRVDITLCSFAIINEIYDLLKIHNFKNVYKRIRLENKNKLGNNFIFSVSFRSDKRLIKYSEKIKNIKESDFVFNSNMDSRKRNNKISKIIKINKNNISKNSFLHKEIENVYDITTETGTFYSCGMIQHNCFAFDCYDLVDKGLPFITNKPSSPAKHADTLLRHTEQLVMSASRQIMGATAVPNVLVIYSALLKNDIENKNYYIHCLYENKKIFKQYLKQEFQKFIYTINQPIREGQSPFTNITLFDSIYMKELCNMYVINDKKIDSEFAMEIQEEFLKIFIDLNKNNLFTFPILTAQFKIDDENNIEDKKFFNFICEQNLEFANINIFASKSLTSLSSCCRLINNIEDILKVVKDENMNLIGGSSIKVGAFGVASINLPRISLYAKGDKELFFERLKELSSDCFKINHCRRELIKKMINDEQLPLYTHGFMDLKNQYSTLGINGMYEAVSFMGLNILDDEGKQFTIDILKTLEEIVNAKIKKYEYRCNIEQIPGESTSIKFAKTDEILYKQNEIPLYSNQFIPLVNETDLINRIELQALFEQYFSGGTIMHANLSEKIESKEVMKNLISYIIKKGVQYHAINYFFAECEDKHITIHEGKKCPICGKKIVNYFSRIVGFITPISSWQKERREEFKERKKYKNGQLNVE